MVKLQSIPFGPLGTKNFFHHEHARLTFSFVQVRFYVAMGRAFTS
jgi:hypothetical protein